MLMRLSEGILACAVVFIILPRHCCVDEVAQCSLLAIKFFSLHIAIACKLGVTCKAAWRLVFLVTCLWHLCCHGALCRALAEAGAIPLMLQHSS